MGRVLLMLPEMMTSAWLSNGRDLKKVQLVIQRIQTRKMETSQGLIEVKKRDLCKDRFGGNEEKCEAACKKLKAAGKWRYDQLAPKDLEEIYYLVPRAGKIDFNQATEDSIKATASMDLEGEAAEDLFKEGGLLTKDALPSLGGYSAADFENFATDLEDSKGGKCAKEKKEKDKKEKDKKEKDKKPVKDDIIAEVQDMMSAILKESGDARNWSVKLSGCKG